MIFSCVSGQPILIGSSSHSAKKTSAVSDQIVVIDDPDPDNEVKVAGSPDIVEVSRLTDQMQEVRQLL